MTTEADYARFVGSLTHDPLAYARAVIPWGTGELEGKQLRTWQAETLAKIGAHLQNPETRHQPLQMATASGHGIGKSATVGMIVSWALDTCKDTRIVVTANTEEQIRGKTWPEICKWRKLTRTASWWNPGKTVIQRATDPSESWEARMVTWSEHNLEAFAGLHNEGKRIVLIMDEGSAIADKVWEVAEGALTDEGTEILWLVFGNMTRATGRFRECFRRFRHRWEGQQIDSRTVEGTNKELFARWEKDWGEDSDFFKVRVRGMPPAQSAKQFISEADVDAAWGKHLRDEQYKWAPVILTCDPAWDGDDELVIGRRQGLRYNTLETLPKNDNDVHVANLLARLEDEHQADAVFVDMGYGTGIVSAGRTMGRDWTLVAFGGKPNDPGYLNKRAEMWGGVKKWLQEGGAIEEDQQLRDDLIGPETVPRLDGKIALEPKHAMKLRGLPSPNRADALCLSFAYPVRAKEASRGMAARPAMEHDPYDDV